MTFRGAKGLGTNPKKPVPAHVEINALIQKTVALIAQKPEKAGKILSEWLKKSAKKTAA